MSFSDLTLFQQTLLAVVGLMLLGSIAALIKGWATRREGLIWVGICLAVGVAVLWPSITSRIAKTFGIGRGADLVFYCAVIVMVIGFWMVYIRLRRVRREITLIVRHQAMLEAERQMRKTEQDEDTSESPEEPSASDSADSKQE
jgi:hypothetical protein